MELKKKHWPGVLIPGAIALLLSLGLGAEKIREYKTDKAIFPDVGIVEIVVDGDTVELVGGERVRMLGINASERGEIGFEAATVGLKNLVEKQKVWFEYDRYQDDKNGRVLAYLWVNCETEKPKFLPADYMHLDGKTSRDYVVEKPEGCRNGTLVNRKMVEDRLVVPVVYEGRGRLKYKL